MIATTPPVPVVLFHGAELGVWIILADYCQDIYNQLNFAGNIILIRQHINKKNGIIDNITNCCDTVIASLVQACHISK